MQLRIKRRVERLRHDRGETSQGQNIYGVVVKDRRQPEGFTPPEIFEIEIGNHFAGNIAFALETQNLALELDQAAAFKAQLPQASCAGQQVKMLETEERG